MKLHHMKTGVVLAAGALIAGCAALPPDMRMGAAPARVVVAQAPFNAAERDFVTRVAAKGMYEIEVSKLATEKALNPAVREFAQTMVRHHTQVNNELIALMSAHGVAPPKGLTADTSSKLHKLASLPRSEAFDNGYIRVVGIEDHRTAIATFERGRRDVRDSDLRLFVDRTLTVLRAHLSMAQNVAAGMAG